MTTTKKLYTPVKIKAVVTHRDIVTESTATATEDPFRKDVYFSVED